MISNVLFKFFLLVVFKGSDFINVLLLTTFFTLIEYHHGVVTKSIMYCGETVDFVRVGCVKMVEARLPACWWVVLTCEFSINLNSSS